MLNFFSRLSLKLGWTKGLAILFGSGFLALLGFSILNENTKESDVYIIPSIMGFIWSMLLYSIAQLFPNVPAIPDPSEKILKRLKVRIKRGFYHILSILFVMISIAAILLSIRMFLIWLGIYAK
ncbi:hypothetical protein FLL45_18200 [Aliikangiella marina]|uniref:Uncharacterized protein n=1 Tax=Aliikangiella marina TaxID=1712262 RepID=A0A545T4K7_9GAMM|nr:hypothetical protein [Aliikangiella marina]TQV72153.1 hypothetical protein FLL45_18200 [Aliikangiella marina]